MPTERIDEQQAVERLNEALSLQMRSALQYSLAAASVAGFDSMAVAGMLTDYGDNELADARLLIEKIVRRRSSRPAGRAAPRRSSTCSST